MREIEFRGKRKDNGEWVYGYLIVDEMSDKYYIFSKGNSCNETDRIGEEGLLHILTFEVIPETLGQYTGLKDKNGKKIFEDDVLDITRPCVYEQGVVIFKNGCFFIKSKETLLALYQCEINNYKLKVIGNIYDNPELLEVQDE